MYAFICFALAFVLLMITVLIATPAAMYLLAIACFLCSAGVIFLMLDETSGF